MGRFSVKCRYGILFRRLAVWIAEASYEHNAQKYTETDTSINDGTILRRVRGRCRVKADPYQYSGATFLAVELIPVLGIDRGMNVELIIRYFPSDVRAGRYAGR